jgi:hypothetical protein
MRIISLCRHDLAWVLDVDVLIACFRNLWLGQGSVKRARHHAIPYAPPKAPTHAMAALIDHLPHYHVQRRRVPDLDVVEA